MKVSKGNTHLGGEDFNTKLIEYFLTKIVDELTQDYVDESVKDNEKAKRKLRINADLVKRTLSS